MLRELQEKLRRQAEPDQAAILQRFFKTGPGEYAEGDKFLGLKVPQVRALAKRYRQLPLSDTAKLLRSPVHEERVLALLLLLQAYRNGDADEQRRIYELYLRNTKFINNWDLVDCSAEHIVGAFLCSGGCVNRRSSSDIRRRSPPAPSCDRRSPNARGDLRSTGVARSGDRPQRATTLKKLAHSDSLWERRIAIMATFHFIKRGEFGPTLRIARLLLGDREDLIHKAAGWMLREVGKRDLATEENFLQKHYRKMPRTMLRYALEKFPERRRQQYLHGKIN